MAYNDSDSCVESLENDFPKVYIIILIISAFAIILNVLTVAAIKRSVVNLNSHYLLVVQQSVADIIFAVSYIPILTYYLSWCQYVSSPVQGCLQATFYGLVSSACCLVLINLTVIALDHFVAVFRPAKYHRVMSVKVVLCLISFMYVFFGLTLATPFLIGLAQTNSTSSVEEYCRLVPHNTVQLYHGTILFCISILVIIPVYIYIFCKAQNFCTKQGTMSNMLKKDITKTTTSLLIIATFMVCFIIDISLLLTQMHQGPSKVIYYVRLVSFALPSLNCICDPLIYAVRLPKVQQGYRQMWHSLHCKKKDSNINLTERTTSSECPNSLSISDSL